jgi:hypothetical protein
MLLDRREELWLASTRSRNPTCFGIRRSTPSRSERASRPSPHEPKPTGDSNPRPPHYERLQSPGRGGRRGHDGQRVPANQLVVGTVRRRAMARGVTPMYPPRTRRRTPTAPSLLNARPGSAAWPTAPGLRCPERTSGDATALGRRDADGPAISEHPALADALPVFWLASSAVQFALAGARCSGGWPASLAPPSMLARSDAERVRGFAASWDD